jgi:cytochrome c-type biogenesis protein CcmH/NrfG
MPLFGGKGRPKLDGLTKDEEKQRDALNEEVMRRAGEKGVAGQAPAAAALLKEKMDTEPGTYLWPLVLGWLMMSMARFDSAAEAFEEAGKRSPEDIRPYFGAGNAYFEAAQIRINGDPTAPVTGSLATLTIDNLLHESNRNFKRAMDLATERDEKDRLRNAISVVDKALAKKAGRL